MQSRTLFATAAFAILALAAACGGSDDDGDDDGGNVGTGGSRAPTPFANDDSFSPQLEGPASLYSIHQQDLGPGYITDVEYTWELDAESYGQTRPFDGQDGHAMLQNWGYQGGYETSYTPEGRSQAVLNGAYTIKVETHLFDSEDGAAQAFDYFQSFLAKSVSEPVTAYALGNQSAAWRYVDVENGVRNSAVAGEFHQYLFRRGNLVAVVLTWGAEPFMEVQTAYELAHLIDEKARGEVETVEPTPVTFATGG